MVVLKYFQEEEAFEYRLRKDQAEAQVQRMKQTLSNVLNENSGRNSNPEVKQNLQKRQEEDKDWKKREEELIATIERLKRVLKRQGSAVA